MYKANGKQEIKELTPETLHIRQCVSAHVTVVASVDPDEHSVGVVTVRCLRGTLYKSVRLPVA
jgi:hypothetical protein